MNVGWTFKNIRKQNEKLWSLKFGLWRLSCRNTIRILRESSPRSFAGSFHKKNSCYEPGRERILLTWNPKTQILYEMPLDFFEDVILGKHQYYCEQLLNSHHTYYLKWPFWVSKCRTYPLWIAPLTFVHNIHRQFINTKKDFCKADCKGKQKISCTVLSAWRCLKVRLFFLMKWYPDRLSHWVKSSLFQHVINTGSPGINQGMTLHLNSYIYFSHRFLGFKQLWISRKGCGATGARHQPWTNSMDLSDTTLPLWFFAFLRNYFQYFCSNCFLLSTFVSFFLLLFDFCLWTSFFRIFFWNKKSPNLNRRHIFSLDEGQDLFQGAENNRFGP